MVLLGVRCMQLISNGFTYAAPTQCLGAGLVERNPYRNVHYGLTPRECEDSGRYGWIVVHAEISEMKLTVVLDLWGPYE